MHIRGQQRGVSRDFQKRRQPGSLHAIADGDRIQQEMQERVANIVHRQVRAGIDDHFVVIAVIAEIRFAAGEQLHVHGKIPRAAGPQNFAKIIHHRENQVRNRRAIDFDAPVVVGLVVLPKLGDVFFAVKIGQYFVEAFQGQRVRRQFIAAQLKFKIRSGAGRQRERHEAGKSGSGIGQGMLIIKFAQSLDGGAVQREHRAAQLDAPGRIVCGVRAGIKSGGVQSAKHGEQLRPRLDSDRLAGFRLDGLRRGPWLAHVRRLHRRAQPEA